MPYRNSALSRPCWLSLLLPLSLLLGSRVHADTATPTPAAASAASAAPASAAAATPAGAATNAAAPSPAKPKDTSFNIYEFRVLGNSVLSELDIDKALEPFLGEHKTIKDVNAARKALEQVYHDHGYLAVTVDIPPQRVSDNTVKLKANEATIGHLRITGSKYHSLDNIRADVPSLAEGKIPDFHQVQRELPQLNGSPDRSVVPILHPSTTPGQVDVELKVEDQLPVHGNVEMDNHYSANTSKLRTSAQLSYDNLWQENHSFSLQYQIAPEKPSETKIATGTYTMPGADNRTYAFYAVNSRSQVAAVGSVNVIGSGNIFGLRVVQALPPLPNLYTSLTYGFDYKNFQQDVLLAGADTGKTPVNYLPWTVQLNTTRIDGKTSSAFNIGANFMLQGLFNHPHQFEQKRANASASYMALQAGYHRLHPLFGNWQLNEQIDGQLASGPLISNEQFAAGGADSVRGYTEGERLGDSGVHYGLELRSPPLGGGNKDSHIKQWYALLFAEGARLWVLQALPSQQADYSLNGTGFGLRYADNRGLGMELDAAHAGNAGQSTKAGSNRLSFKVSYDF